MKIHRNIRFEMTKLREIKKSYRRLKLTLVEVIKKNISIKKVTKNIILD